MNTYWKNGLVLFLFITLTVYYTWPLALHVQDGFISGVGIGDDAFLNLWNIDTFKNALLNGQSPYTSDKIFAPLGADLTTHGYMPAMSVFSMLFDNNLLALNVYTWIHFIFSAFGAYLLAVYLTNSRIVGMVSGIAFGFSAYRLLRLECHVMLVLTAAVPFYILAFLKAFAWKEGTWLPKIISYKHVIYCFLLGIFSLLNDFYSTFYLIYFSGAFLLYYPIIFYWKRWSLKKRIFFTAAFLALMHLLIQTMKDFGVDDRGGFYWGGDVLSFFIPNQNSWLYDRSAFLNYFSGLNVKEGVEYELFLGYSGVLLLLFIVVSLFRKRESPKGTGPFLFVLVILFLIALPTIKVNGITVINAPTSLLHFIPFFNNIRCNTRIELMITLFLPILAGWFWIERIRQDQGLGKYVIASVFCLFMLIDLKAKPYRIVSLAEVPRIYDTIKKEPGTVLLTLPVGLRDGAREIGKYYPREQYYQVLHGKRITGGYISRLPSSTFDFFDQDSVMHTLFSLSKDTTVSFQPASAADRTRFFDTFKPDMILLDAAYRHSSLEVYTKQLISGRKYRVVEKDNYWLVIFE